MPVTVTRRTPGVYVEELAAFPPSVVGVQTAVPAFIGYTAKAEISGKPAFLKPIKIGSLADYQAVFGGEFDPTYTLNQVQNQTEIDAHNYSFKIKDPSDGEKFYLLNPPAPPAPHFNLYNSMRLFYNNGGGNCYVVSVNSYKKADGSFNQVSETDLTNGLNAIKEQVGPTMLVIPDAVLLPADSGGDPWVSSAFQSVVRKMLEQCQTLQDRFAILDVYGSQYVVDQSKLDSVIDRFRTDVDDLGLDYGAGYFPFLQTTVVPVSDYDYTNISPLGTAAGVDPDTLKTILLWEDANLYNGGVLPVDPQKGTPRFEKVKEDINKMGTPVDVRKLNDALTASLPLLGDMLRIIAAANDVLPPSGGMAGIYTLIDGSRGVWNAPANITLNSVVKPTYKLNDAQQGDLNVPVDGKAVDAIREFTGRGTVVWGARTLDGNSPDYRYIQIRRTLIYIEQSLKNALNQFVFAANDGNTWVTVISMCSAFLQGVWQQGGLMGATASEAFTVECGLGSTMTPQDVLDGYMIVQVTLQMIRPAEFIVLTFKQKMEGVA